MSDPADPADPRGHEETPGVGSLGEEAVRLLGALSGWASDHGPGDQAADHVATGAAECTYCPLCRTVHVVRRASPEVRAHLAAAGSSFLQAVAGVLSSLPPPPSSPSSPASGSGSEFEKIDLDGDDS